MAYWMLKLILTPLLRIFYRVRTDGVDNVPRSGPAILASNHHSFIDSIFLPLVVWRRVTFVAKAEYFESWKTAWFFRALGMIPIKRGDGPASQRALAAACEVLQSGRVLAIYPEGTRSRDGRLHRGHTGVARMALRCGAPVVPVAQFGTVEVQPIGSTLPKLFKRVEVKMGAPIRWDEAPAPGHELTAYRQFTERVMSAIQAMSGQEMAEGYAAHDPGRWAAPGSEAEPMPAVVPAGAPPLL